MGLLAFIKDKVGDQFGVYDDVQDFVDFAERTADAFERKAATATKLVDQLQRELSAATEVEDLKSDRIRQLKAVLQTLSKDMSDLRQRTAEVIAKAGKVKEIKDEVAPALTKINEAQSSFAQQMKDAQASLTLLEEEQETMLRKLDAEDEATVASSRRKLAVVVGRVVGTISSLTAMSSLILRALKVF